MLQTLRFLRVFWAMTKSAQDLYVKASVLQMEHVNSSKLHLHLTPFLVSYRFQLHLAYLSPVPYFRLAR